MTDELPAVTFSHPPERLLRVANPTMGFLLHTPLVGSLRKQMMVVTVTGRRSGRKSAFPVNAHQVDGALYALTGAPWKNNFRDGAEAHIVYNGKNMHMHGELITDPVSVGELAHRCAASYGVKRAQAVLGLTFREPRMPTVGEFTEAAAREKIGAIRFTPSR